MVVRISFFVSRGCFWRSFQFFTSSSSFSVVLRLWGKHFGFFVKLIWLGCQNWFQVSRGHLWKSCFFKKNSRNCFFVFGLRVLFFGILAKIFRLICKNCIPCVQWRFLFGLFFLRNVLTLFTVFGLWVKYSGRLTQKLQEDCQNWILRVRKRFSERFCYLKKKIFPNFSSFSQKLCGLLSKRCPPGFKKCLSGLSRETFSVRISFSSNKIMSFYGIWGRMFLNFGQIFQQVRQNCTLSLYVSEGDFWVNCFFYDFFWASSLFSDCGKNILQHWPKIFGKCVKTLFYWNNKFFEENLFSEENTYFYNFFDFWSKPLRTFVQKYSIRFQKLLSTLVQGIFLLIIIMFLEKVYAD